MSTLLRLIRGFKSEGQGGDIPQNPDIRPKNAFLPKEKEGFQHAFVVMVWPRAPMRLGWVECAACGHKEKIKARISVIQQIECAACGEAKARFMPGSTPLEPPVACPCGNNRLLLKQAALWCLACHERVVVNRQSGK